jgi:hypothetical protein
MRFETFGFSNISSDECRLKGTPVVRLLDSSGSLEDWDVSRCEESTTAKCLEVDAILPTGAPTPTHLGGGVPGQAVLVLNWDRCDLPAAQCNCTSDVASIAIDLPSDGGNFTIPFDAPHSFCGGIFVEQFKPAVRPTPVPGSQPELTATLKLPPTIESGSILYYDVQLTNVSTSAPWAFGDPCPNYNAFVGEHIGPGFQSLNCRPAIAIQPGGTVDFAMQMDIPADTEPGDYPVYWTFFDGQSAIPAGGFDVEHPGPKYWITVTAP